MALNKDDPRWRENMTVEEAADLSRVHGESNAVVGIPKHKFDIFCKLMKEENPGWDKGERYSMRSCDLCGQDTMFGPKCLWLAKLDTRCKLICYTCCSVTAQEVIDNNQIISLKDEPT